MLIVVYIQISTIIVNFSVNICYQRMSETLDNGFLSFCEEGGGVDSLNYMYITIVVFQQEHAWLSDTPLNVY